MDRNDRASGNWLTDASILAFCWTCFERISASFGPIETFCANFCGNPDRNRPVSDAFDMGLGGPRADRVGMCSMHQET